MAAHTPLPPSLRRGLAAFSSSLFTNNKTQDSGTPRTHHPGTGTGARPQRGLGGFRCGSATTSLLSAAPKHPGASGLGAPEGSLHPPTDEREQK